MPNIDLSELIPQKTLSITVSSYQGEKSTWEIPPFDNETEHFYWKWQKELNEKRMKQQQLDMGMEGAEELPGDENQTVGEIWAPLLAAVVKNHKLEAEQLISDYPGVVLARAGGAVMSFFLTDQVPGQEQTEPTETKTTPSSDSNVSTLRPETSN